MEWKRSFASLVVLALGFGTTPAWAQSQEPAQQEQSAQAPAEQPKPAQQAQTPPAMLVTKTDGVTHMALLQYDFTKGQHAIPNFFKVYTPMQIPRHVEENLPGLEPYLQNGKLVLSLQDAVELGLRNNLDISVQRWITYQSDAAVLSAKSGPGFLTPTGPFITFDPILSSTLGWQRNSFPINNPLSSGSGSTAVGFLTNQATVGNFSYQQAFPTGSAFNVSLNTTRSSSTSQGNLFNPAVNSSMTAVFQQPLLQGFGFAPNLRFLRVARNNRRVADLAFEQQVITSTVAVMNSYFELVFAIQDVGVKQKSLALNEKLYNDNKRQVEIGTLAPIEITRAAAAVAAAKGDMINSQTLALQDETNLKNLIFRNVMASGIAELSVVPTDKPDENMQVPDITLESAVAEAKDKRPDVKQAIINLDSSKIVVKATHNLLLPSLSLNAQYGTQGLGGDACLMPAMAPATGTTICSPPSPQPFRPGDVRVPGGLHDALAEVFQSQFPNYSVFLNFQMPIRNRLNQAQDINAKLQQRQNEAALQRTNNVVAADVRNALITLTQDKAAVETAIQSRILAEQTLDAEQKKFLLGATTTYNVVLTERDLATARSVEVRALANLAEAKVNFDRALGRTLESSRIEVTDALHPGPTRIPLIPGTPSADATASSRAQ